MLKTSEILAEAIGIIRLALLITEPAEDCYHQMGTSRQLLHQFHY